MKHANKREKFSDKLEKWLSGSQPKTLNSLSGTFADKSFAVIVLLLMSVPALPLPTGGVTHVFEIITIILALEFIVGFDAVWLPSRLRRVKLVPSSSGKTVSRIITKLRWLERKSTPRMAFLFQQQISSKIIWTIILAFSATAFLAPPFSGLDTLPALGVVLICLSIILEDGLFLLVGFLLGLSGVVVIIGLANFLVNLVSDHI